MASLETGRGQETHGGDPPTRDVAALVDIALPSWDAPDFDVAAERARRRLEQLITDRATGLDEVTAACSTLLRLDALQTARAESDQRARAHDLGSLSELLSSVATHDVDALFTQGTAELGRAMGFRRSLFSAVSGAMWLPHCLFIDPELDDDTAELRRFLDGARWHLEAAPLESEVVRRRAPRLVQSAQDNAQTYRPLMEMSQSRSYVVAPVWARRRVVGLLHADRWGEPITPDDLERLDAYAQCFGAAAETALLRRRVTALAERHGAAMSSTAGRLGAFDDRPPPIVPAGPGVRDASSAARPRLGDGAHDEHATSRDDIPDTLSPREGDVLLELSRGLTNAEIGARLGLSEGTVKSYVKNILRKLEVPTRAAATAKWERWRAGRPVRHAG